MNKQKRLEILFVVIAVICTFLVMTRSDFFGKKLDVEVGQIATETIFAPFQVENEVATERKRELAENSVQDIYTVNEAVFERAQENIQLLFDYAIAIQSSDIATQFDVSPLVLLQGKSPIPLYEDEYKTLLQTSSDELERLEQITLEIAEETLKQGIKAYENTTLKIRSTLEKTELSAMHQKVAYEIISSQIKPNIIIDEETTSVEKQKARESVEPVYILQGEKVIEQGSRVTDEAYQVLGKIGYLETDDQAMYVQYFGLTILILLVGVFISRYVTSYKDVITLQLRQTSLIFILYMLSLAFITAFKPAYFVFLPLSIGPILIAILIKRDLAIIMHFILLIVSSVAHKGDIIFALYMLLTGIMTIYIIGEMQQRKQTMRSAMLVGGINAVIYISVNLVVGVSIESQLLLHSAEAFLVGVVSIILVVGSLPLWEAAFGFVTPIQLLELTNPNQPVLKRLLIEATGTYYHSLLVANLAEAAADEIGANALMTRVGGYYHDIGKLTCSNYFKENQVLENPHDYMDARSSANIIVSHTSSGIEIAEMYKLPKCVKDMIEQHHGTGVIQYFYFKAQQEEADVDAKEFQYPGPKPQTREAALIMLADVVEATVRAMQHKIGKEVTVEDLVRKMIKQKLDEGQLDECPLYISDIEKIITSFTRMLKGMYHERIEYPDKKG